MTVAGVAGAPVWATIAVGVGVAALAFGAYYLLTSPSGIGVTMPGTDPVVSSPFPPTLPGQTLDASNGVLSAYPDSTNNYISQYAPYVTAAGIITSGNYISGTTDPCLPGMLMCAMVSVLPPAPQTITAPLDQVIPQIPDVALQTPLDPQSVADIATQLLNAAAAKPGYMGLPVPLGDPVTAADVMNWSMQNPGAMPTPADVLAPMPQPVTIPNPVVSPTPTPTPTPTTSTTVDLGPDPGIGVPGLEDVPTAASILAPLLNLFPDLRSYVVPSHSAECPKPSMELWGKTLTLQGHCDLLDSPAVRQTLYLIMAAVWVMVALFIVLAA